MEGEGIVKYCPNCGRALESEGGQCTQCEPSDPKSVSGEAVSPAIEDNEPKLFSEVVRQRSLEKKQELQAERRQERLEKLENLKNTLGSAWRRFVELRKLTFPITGVFLLAVSWGIGQWVVYSVNGPDEVLNRYVDAVNSNNWDALSDDSLFAQSAGTEAGGATKTARQSSSRVSLGAVARDGNAAEASMTMNGSKYDINLKAELEFSGLFWVPKWAITTPAPTLAIKFDSVFDPGQIALVGGEEVPLTAATTIHGARVVVLPGSYLYVVKAAGFMAESSATQTVVKDAVTLRVENGGLAVSSAAEKAVDKKTAAAAKTCFKKKCKALGKWRDTDFSFWSWWPYDKYTNYKFSWKGSFQSCNGTSYTLISPTKVIANSTCNGEIKAKMYIRWVYYYGWYSNYWRYANYKDSRTTSVSTSVEVTTTLDGKKVSVGKVKING